MALPVVNKSVVPSETRPGTANSLIPSALKKASSAVRVLPSDADRIAPLATAVRSTPSTSTSSAPAPTPGKIATAQIAGSASITAAARTANVAPASTALAPTPAVAKATTETAKPVDLTRWPVLKKTVIWFSRSVVAVLIADRSIKAFGDLGFSSEWSVILGLVAAVALSCIGLFIYMYVRDNFLNCPASRKVEPIMPQTPNSDVKKPHVTVTVPKAPEFSGEDEENETSPPSTPIAPIKNTIRKQVDKSYVEKSRVVFKEPEAPKLSGEEDEEPAPSKSAAQIKNPIPEQVNKPQGDVRMAPSAQETRVPDAEVRALQSRVDKELSELRAKCTDLMKEIIRANNARKRWCGFATSKIQEADKEQFALFDKTLKSHNDIARSVKKAKVQGLAYVISREDLASFKALFEKVEAIRVETGTGTQSSSAKSLCEATPTCGQRLYKLYYKCDALTDFLPKVFVVVAVAAAIFY